MRTRPSWLLRIWSLLIPRGFREELLGDLTEAVDRVRAHRGRWAAGVWLASEMVRTPYLRLRRQSRARRTGRGGQRRSWLFSSWLDGIDSVRIAARVLSRRPGFAGVAVGTLALSVGAATVIFGLLEAVLLRPLPYPDAERLHVVYGTNEAWRDGDQEFFRENWDRAGISSEMVESFDALATVEAGGYQAGSVPLQTGEGPAGHIPGGRVGEGFFRTVGTEPLLGRTPSPAEHRSGEHVVVIHETLWARQFGRDPEVLGRTLDLDGAPHTVVGVMPRTFALPEEGSLWWTPFPAEWAEYRDATILNAVARLAPGSETSSVTESINAAMERLASANPAYDVMGARLVSLREEVLGSVSGGLRLLFAAVCVVVLIACVNLANLVVARGARRLPELALRAALGAGRAGLAVTMLLEVALVCLLGAALGVILAAATLAPLVELMMRGLPDFPRAADVSLNTTVLGFSLGVTVLTALLAGLPPTLAATRRAPADILGSADRGSRSRGVRRVQATLLFAESALAMLLLVGAGLLTRSMARVSTLDPGFDSRGVAYVSLRMPEDRFPARADALEALDALERGLSGAPGITSLAEARSLPSLGGSQMVPVRPEGTAGSESALTVMAAVGPGYFETLSIPVLRGRAFEAADDADAPPVAVVSESLARRLFGADDPVGRFITQAEGAVMRGGRTEAGDEESVEVVGVVGDVRQLALVREAEPVLYRPFRQTTSRSALLALSTSGNTRAALEPVRATAAHIEGLVVEDMGVFREQTLELLAPVRLRTVLLGALSSLAAVLAMVGIYGVVSYVVSDRRREIGIRIALGARAEAETHRVVRVAMVPSLGGATVGVIAALGTSRVLESSIYEISRLDPVTYGAAFGLLLSVATLAAWWPARTAARVDPVEVLDHG